MGIFYGFCLFGIIKRKVEQKIDESKKNIYQQFKAQSEMIKSVVHVVCTLLIENFKTIFKSQKKKVMDERVNSEKPMLQQQMSLLKKVNLQVPDDVEELEQNGKCLSLRIDGVPVKEKERSQEVSEHIVVMIEKGSAGNVYGYIDRNHRVR